MLSLARPTAHGDFAAESTRHLDALRVIAASGAAIESEHFDRRELWKVAKHKETIAGCLRPFAKCAWCERHFEWKRQLDVEHYRALPAHEPGWIAARLGIGREEEERCLAALAASKLIRRRQQRWVVTQVLTVDTRRNPEAGRRLKRHWAEVGQARLPTLEPAGEDLFSYNLFTIAERDWQSFRELHIAYYHELRRLVEASNPAERVVLVNLQLLRLDREPAA